MACDRLDRITGATHRSNGNRLGVLSPAVRRGFGNRRRGWNHFVLREEQETAAIIAHVHAFWLKQCGNGSGRDPNMAFGTDAMPDEGDAVASVADEPEEVGEEGSRHGGPKGINDRSPSLRSRRMAFKLTLRLEQLEKSRSHATFAACVVPGMLSVRQRLQPSVVVPIVSKPRLNSGRDAGSFCAIFAPLGARLAQ